jgi:3'-5' exoribonuclease
MTQARLLGTVPNIAAHHRLRHNVAAGVCQDLWPADDSMIMTITEIDRTAGLCDVTDGSVIDRVLLVGDVQRCTTRAGTEFVRLFVKDRTARLPAVMWEPSEAVDQGPVLRVLGRVSDHPRYGRQVVVAELQHSESQETDLGLLLAGPDKSLAELIEELDCTIAAIGDRWLRALVERLLGRGGELRERFIRAPAAKCNHHAFPSGLLEHTLQVVAAVRTVGASYRGVDCDLAIAGGLLHDIGKLDAYNENALAVDLTDAGRLEGEIPMGYYTVRRTIELTDGFPAEPARLLLHIILSHHGLLEHGSPVVPCTREATLVHAMDELSGRLGAFDRLERETADGQAWSRYDRVLGTSACLP